MKSSTHFNLVMYLILRFLHFPPKIKLDLNKILIQYYHIGDSLGQVPSLIFLLLGL